MGSARWPLVAACGKFQPFHNDHLKYILSALEVGEHTIIGITNPDPWYIRPEEADTVRGTPEANPATYYERHMMVAGALRDLDVDRDRFDIVPFPINMPRSWFYYIPRSAVFVVTLYEDDRWLELRKRKLEEAGIMTHVLWAKNSKDVTGAEIRHRILANEDWEHLVPPATARVIQACGIDRRVRELASNTAQFYVP